MINRLLQSTGRRGFTLVELLVVIVIVAALAGLAMLVSRKASASAYMVQSTARIKSLGQANALYASDHNGKYVPIITTDNDSVAGVQWHFNPEFLSILIGNVEFLDGITGYEGIGGVPEQVLDPVTVKAKKLYWDRFSGSYGHNLGGIRGFEWGGRNQTAQQTLMSIQDPTRTFNFITSTDWLAKFDGRYIWSRNRANAVEGKTGDGKIAYRHGRKAIAVFYDGHTELISPADMQKFDARGGVNNAFWGGTR